MKQSIFYPVLFIACLLVNPRQARAATVPFEFGSQVIQLTPIKETQRIEKRLLNINQAIAKSKKVSISLLLKRGYIYYQLEKIPQALRESETILKLEPKNIEAIHLHAKCLSPKNPLQALQNLDRIAATHPQKKELHVDRAIAYFHLKKHQVAIIECNKELKKFPKSREALLARSACWHELKEYEKAVSDLTAILVQCSPEEHKEDYLYARGLAYSELGQFKKAILDFKAVSKSIPNSYGIQVVLLTTYRNSGQTEKAILMAEQIIKKRPKDSIPHLFIADTKRSLKQYRAALAAYEKSYLLEKKYKAKIFVGNQLSMLLATCPDVTIRNYPKSIKYAKEVCKLTKWKDWLALAPLATAYAESGDFKEAIQWQEKAIELAPKKVRKSLIERLELYQNGKSFYAPKPKAKLRPFPRKT